MSSDLTKLLYICPPFKPIKTTKSNVSFIKLRVEFGGCAVWHIFYCRDTLGLGWIAVKRDKVIQITNPSLPIFISGVDFNKDQMFRTWLPVNLCIRTRKARTEILKQIGTQAVQYFIKNPAKMNVCIPRMLVFKQPDSTLSYAFELIDGDDSKTVACSIGNENILNSSEFASKGILYSPIFNIGRGDESEEDDYKPPGKWDDNPNIGEDNSDVEEHDEGDERPPTPDNQSEFSFATNERVFHASYERIDPLEEASKIPDGGEVKDIPFSLTKAPRQNKGKAVVVEKLSTKPVRRRKKTSDSEAI